MADYRQIIKTEVIRLCDEYYDSETLGCAVSSLKNDITDFIDSLPDADNGIVIRGKAYGGIEHWLYNIHAQLLNKWYNEAMKHKDGTKLADIPELEPLAQDVENFRAMCKRFLGYEYKGTLGFEDFVDINDDTKKE